MKNFIDYVNECLLRAEELYSIDTSRVDIRLDIRGTTIAGQAVHHYASNTYSLRFHPEAIENHFDEMVAETIPHEVAHIVCFIRPDLGCNHDVGWKAVCQALGGEGRRCHDMKFGTKKERWYLAGDEKIDLGLIRHNKLQRGKVQSYGYKHHTITKDNYIGESCG